jgi:SAM-dependent methyltransferase
MIFLIQQLNVNPYEVKRINSAYLSLVGMKHIKTCATRGWDYAAIEKNGNFSEKDIVLDVGCAASYLGLYLLRFVQKVYGIDDIQNGGFATWSEPWVKSLDDYEEYKKGRFVFHDQNAATLPFADEYFDKVVTVSALEHFRGHDDTLCSREVARVLKPGGLFLGTVDYNAATEFPKGRSSACRTYTYQAFTRRILNPSRLALVGTDFVAALPVPPSVSYLASALFFCLQKTEIQRSDHS